MSKYEICEKIWLNGDISDTEKPIYNLLASPLHYGIGITDSVRGYKFNDNILLFRLKDHLQRFFDSSKLYRINLPFNLNELEKGILELVKENDIQSDCYIRILAYPSHLNRLGVVHALEADVHVSIIATSYPSNLVQERYQQSRSAIVSSWKAIPHDVLPVHAKAIGHLANHFIAGVEAKDQGADTAILLDHNGLVCEICGANIFLIRKDNKIVTPPLHASILWGITRDTLINAVGHLDLEVQETDITRSELYTAGEIFTCGTAIEIAPINYVDGIKITEGPGKTTLKIADYLKKIVVGQKFINSEWHTSVY